MRNSVGWIDRIGLLADSGILLVLALCISFFSVLVYGFGPFETERCSEFYLLGADGEAGEYPVMMQSGKAENITLGITNHEGHGCLYFVEVYLISRSLDPQTGLSEVTGVYRIGIFDTYLKNEQNTEFNYVFTPKSTAYDRLDFLLYLDNAPPQDQEYSKRAEAAYCMLNLEIAVE